MNIADILHIKNTVSMSQLRQNPREIIRTAEDLPVAVLIRGKPEFYLLSAKAYEALLDLLDNTTLIETINDRSGSKTLKVKVKSY